MPEQTTRTDRKRSAIAEGAAKLFVRDGYSGTSMDDIAAAAGVAKQTVYKHFSDKETLFCYVIEATVRAASDPVYDAVGEFEVKGDLETALITVARHQLELVLQPQLMQLRRLVIAEASRFPHLGEVFFDQGPRRTIDALALMLSRLSALQLLQIDDPTVAAIHFNWLVMAEPLNRAMLLGLDAPPTPEALDRWATAGVATFLAAFRSGGRQGIGT